MSTDVKKTVLFICTHNSARSQIAEALINKFKAATYEAYSAGTEPTMANPCTIKVMAEIGIDISGNQAKHIKVYKGRTFEVGWCNGAFKLMEMKPGYEGAVDIWLHELCGMCKCSSDGIIKEIEVIGNIYEED